MIDIKINITNKIANAIGTPFIVCGNSDYTVTFTFDAEWGAYQEKTARFFFVSDGIEQYIDVLFSGNTCNAPVLPNIEKVLIGVYTGNLRTTTGAEVRCKRSILFGGKVHEPPTTEDVYNEILEIVSKKLGSEGGTVTGDYYKDGNTFIHEGNLELVEPKINEVLASEKLVETATGSAITIDSANAPLQQLKLYGKTTQDGTPTPDNPIELKSVGDSGSYEVGVFGNNLLNVSQSITIARPSYLFNDLHIYLKANETYTFSAIITEKCAFTFAGRNKSGSDVFKLTITEEKANQLTTVTVTPTQDVFWVRCYVDASNVTFTNSQINKGTTVLPYEPCNKKTLTLTDTLRGVGDIADEKDFARGVATKRIKKTTFDGSADELWNLFGDSTRGVTFVIKISDGGIGLQTSKCNKFNNVNGAWGTDYANVYGIYTDHPSTRERYFRPPNSSITTVEQWKTWLSENPIELQYVTTNVTETPLTETELNAYRHLMTNKGTSTILSEADMEISYYVNKPNAQAIGSLHEQINKDYFKLQQAIILTGGN